MQTSQSILQLLNKEKSNQKSDLLPTQNVIGFPVSALSFDEQVAVIMQWARKRVSRVVCVSNVHMLMEGHWHRDFAHVLTQADMLTPDGMPLVWLASVMKGQTQDRVAGMELMMALCKQAEAAGISVFFLGSTPDLLKRIRRQLMLDFPDLAVAGMVSPPFRALSFQEDEAIITEINESKAGLVFVSLGCPKQEHWMFAHRGRVSVTMVGLGGAFSVYAGVKQWAPEWMRKYGLEWCYRLIQEPRRLWKRYALTIPPFLWMAFKQVVKLKLGFYQDISVRKNT